MGRGHLDGDVVQQWFGLHAALVRLEREYREAPPGARGGFNERRARLYAEVRACGFNRRAMRQAVKHALGIPNREVFQLAPEMGRITRVVLGPKPPTKKRNRRRGQGHNAGVRDPAP